MINVMNNLQGFRESKGLTRLETAQKLRVSLISYTMWEEGKAYPSRNNQKKLNKLLGGFELCQKNTDI